MGEVEPVTMSVRSTPLARTATESLPTLQALAEMAIRPIRFVAFWMATLLPFTYLPLLATGTLTTHPGGFAALVCLNAVAYVVGHPYKRPE